MGMQTVGRGIGGPIDRRADVACGGRHGISQAGPHNEGGMGAIEIRHVVTRRDASTFHQQTQTNVMSMTSAAVPLGERKPVTPKAR